MKPWRIIHGDCREAMAALPECSVDAVVCDPPYALTANKKGGSGVTSLNLDSPAGRSRISTGGGFMGKAWDSEIPGVEIWAEALRVAKPGAHLVAFGGTRTFHRLACAIEDAGWEIRDCLSWLYGSGFPKSLDVSKAIDKAEGAEREFLRIRHDGVGNTARSIHKGEGFAASREQTFAETSPATESARQWQGWGTALKPAWESIILARKPDPEGDLQAICAILAHKIAEAVCRLSSFARDAESASPSSRSALGAASDSARWGAVAACNTPAALFALMDTWRFESDLPSSLSIASSWLATLAGVSSLASTFTTEMASSLTTELRTLNCSPSPITPSTIIEAATCGHGTVSSASLVADTFSGARSKLLRTLDPSALGPVTSKDGETGLRPNWRPIILARKPLVGTVARNVQEHGTGAINVDGCRIGVDGGTTRGDGERRPGTSFDVGNFGVLPIGAGRWPANVTLGCCGNDPHDADCAVAMLDEQSGELKAPGLVNPSPRAGMGFGGGNGARPPHEFPDSGGASRFFYTAKASRSEREIGLDGIPALPGIRSNAPRANETEKTPERTNHHPTVKPVDLMRWLVRLVTPPGGTVLDPFAGSGSTLIAALREGFACIGIEREEAYIEIARRRIEGDAPLLNVAMEERA